MPNAACCLAAMLLMSTLAAAVVPPVLLSEQHKAMCKVGVGDAMPPLDLTDAAGAAQALSGAYGKRATVVVLVGHEHWMNPALLSDLPKDVVAPYADKGVATVVVRVGDSPVKPPAGSPLSFLHDPDGAGFAKIGSGRVPRVYVLDADGKIVWFDIEYSRTTRRELKQTLATLTEQE